VRTIEQGKTNKESLLDKVRITGHREGGLIEAYVPFSLIYSEDVPVDKSHVEDLTASMQEEKKKNGSTGQLSPVLLGQVPEFPKFPIIDGFHRTSSLRTQGATEIFTTIRPNCTWEEVTDHRILAAATSHKSIKFARLIDWVDEAWKYSPWKDDLKVSQAFALRFQKKMTGKYMGLDSEQVKEIRNWVDKKCIQWHISAAYVYKHLHIAETVDPKLVKEARERSSGHHLDALTPLHLAVIAKVIPNKFDLQNIVADEVKKEMLTVELTKILVNEVAKAETRQDVNTIIAKGTFLKAERVDNVNMPHQKPIENKGEHIVFTKETGISAQIQDLDLESYLQSRDGQSLTISDFLNFVQGLQEMKGRRKEKFVAACTLAGLSLKGEQGVSKETFIHLFTIVGKSEEYLSREEKEEKLIFTEIPGNLKMNVARVVISGVRTAIMDKRGISLHPNPCLLLRNSMSETQLNNVYASLEKKLKEMNKLAPTDPSEMKRLLALRFIVGSVREMWQMIKLNNNDPYEDRYKEDIQRIFDLKTKYRSFEELSGDILKHFSAKDVNDKADELILEKDEN
jgi:hypothetical protein